MSRHHNTGEISARDMKALISRQVSKAMYDSLSDAEYNYMSEQVTIIHYCAQYASVAIEELADHFEGNNCEFTIQAQKKGKVAVLACNAFTDYFEPLIHPDNKSEWADEYGQFQYALSNFLNKDRASYQTGSDAERAKEICRAAALRYHDPMETNLQRTFEAGFREGAAYADLHPLDSITILDNGVKKKVTLKELAEAYTGKSDIIVELNAKKQ